MENAYGINQIGLNGSGETIGIVESAYVPFTTLVTELQSFDNYVTAPSFTFTEAYYSNSVAATTSSSGGIGGETALDIEWAHAMAPGANILLVVGANSDWIGASDYAAQAGASVVSMSYGNPETVAAANGVEAEGQAIFTNPSYSNVSFVASSGDQHYNTYYTSGSETYGEQFDYPASSPNVVAVGGTEFASNSNPLASQQSAWTRFNLGSSPNNNGGGGGVSTLFAQPSFQTSAGLSGSVSNILQGGNVSLGSGRDVPDVSMDATGALVNDIFDFGPTGWSNFYGTSLSSPMFAGVVADVDQGLNNIHLSTIGTTALESKLYSIYGGAYHTSAFTDIPTGSNNNYFSTATGYDLATGLGTPITPVLVGALSDDLAAPVQNGPVGSIGTFTPTLSWNAVAGAVSYDFSLTDLTTSSTILSMSTTGTSYSVPNGDLTNGHSYSWSVSSVNALNQVGPSSTSTESFILSVTNPHISVSFNTQVIVDGESNPSTTTGTAFGGVSVGATEMEIYTVTNSGAGTLSLSNFSVTGDPSEFKFLTDPAASLTAGSSSLFAISFSPLTVGNHSATINIFSNDASQANPFTFAVNGTGVPAPFTALSSKGQPIADGETTPITSNDTDFGSTYVGGAGTTATFKITNSGTATLNLTGTPIVQISGVNATDFIITQPTVKSLTSGTSTTFQVLFLPGAAGLRTATLAIKENDSIQADPFTFAIQGTGNPSAKIQVTSNGQTIADGETSPSTTNGTDFGLTASGGPGNTETFTITNSGTATLNLAGNPIVQIGGANAADFTITQPTVNSLAPGKSTTFQVLFLPSAIALHTATLAIAENDLIQGSPFTFAIQGTGVISPYIQLSSNSQPIADGETLPSVTNGTDFGTTLVRGPGAAETFTITNPGSATLNLTGTPVVQFSGTNAADFTLLTPPTMTSLAPGSSTTFQVLFMPGGGGLRTATMLIPENDLTQTNPSTFAIRGTGRFAPEAQINAEGLSMTDGETSPTFASGTDFGSTPVGEEGATTIYTITNAGSATLLLTGTPIVVMSGADTADFLLSQPLASSLAPGNSTTFQIQFLPSGGGLQTAAISIADNDAILGSPFTFAIQGTGIAVPDIAISSNTQPIVNGATSPTTTNDTDFGTTFVAGTPVTETFTIANIGTATLNLTGTPIVQVSGANAADFSITQPTMNSLAPASSTTFQVTFLPSASGLRTATLSVADNDNSQGQPFTFGVQGTGSTGTLTLNGGKSTTLAFKDANDFVVTTDGVATAYSTSTFSKVVDDVPAGTSSQVVFSDTFNTYMATQSLGSTQLTTQNFEFDTAGVTSLFAYANGTSKATINLGQGTESNFYVNAESSGYSYLADPAHGIYSELSGFNGQTVIGSGGSTYAYIYVAQGAAVVGDPAGSSITTGGDTVSLDNFPQLYLVGAAGGNDSITLHSEGGTFVGTPGYSYVSGKYQGAPFFVGALYFSSVTAQASSAGTDTASFYSYSGDTFNGAVGLSSLAGSTADIAGNPYDFQTQASGYLTVTTYESGSGTDDALLTSSGNGTFTGTPTYSQLAVGTSTITVNTFIVNGDQSISAVPSKVSVVGNDTDTANLDDAPGSNSLLAVGNTATLTTSTATISLASFKSVNAYQIKGQDDAVHQSAFDAALTLNGNWIND